MPTRPVKPVFVFVLLASLLAGCGTSALQTTPRWDARFGDATRALFAQQVLNPAAARDTRPVTGIDGHAAAASQQRYQKSFMEPPPPANVFTIGVTGAQ